MSISATARKRDKLAAQLTWLANRHILGLPEDRRHETASWPAPTRATTIVMPDGLAMVCRIIDMSLSGRPRSRAKIGPRSACLVYARQDPEAASCATSRTASRSSSPACSTLTFSKRNVTGP